MNLQIPYKQKNIEYLQSKSKQIRKLIVDILTKANSSHLGSALSIVDILTVIYHKLLDIKKIEKQSVNRDYFILSKGHAASALYATLYSVGLIKKELLNNYLQNNTPLCGHPIKNINFGIETSTGSLGQGLPMSVGIALSLKRDKKNNKVYTIIGDGECQEGSIWESIILASRLNLDNLTIIVDYNNLQGMDRTNDIMPGTLEEKFKSFHCNVKKVNGHDHQEILETIVQTNNNKKPKVIIAKTIKGKGISFIEDKLEWHYKSLNPEQYKQAQLELEQ